MAKDEMALEPIERNALTHAVLRNLRRYILSNHLMPGDRLPTERDLARELAVGRSTVREALAVLEVIGAVNRQPKRGTVLAQIDFGLLAEISQFLMLRTEEDFESLFEARRILETSILPLVLERSDPEVFDELDGLIDQAEAEVAAGGDGIELDAAFHEAVLRASGNNFLAQFGAMIHEFFDTPVVRKPLTREDVMKTISDHRGLVQSLRDGKLDEAEGRLEAHLGSYEQRGLVKHRPSRA